LSEARTKMPMAVKVVKRHDHEVLWRRALVLQAQATLAGATRLDQLSFARGVLAGRDRWWLDQRGITWGVPATDNLAVTVDARAQAAAGEVVTLGRRVHTVRHGTESCGNGPPSRSEDRSHDENFDMLPNGFRKHRGKDCTATNKRGGQREHRHLFVAEA
jgi:hypothetical protein